MRKYSISLILIILLLIIIFPTSPVRADGIIWPEPPICPPDGCLPPPCPEPGSCLPPRPSIQLAIRYHRVNVKIDDQIAITTVDQVFYNPNNYPVEGVYLFPIPLDASISTFSLLVDGKSIKGHVLDAETAREKYEEIVQEMRDPALLEYADRGVFQAHIFPIPAHGEQRIELEYSQVLDAESGLVKYIYPLNTEKFSLWPLEQVVINIEINSSVPIQGVYSPSHQISINRSNEHNFRLGYESSNVRPDTDFAVYYSVGTQEALHLLSYKNPDDIRNRDGFFLLLLSPPTGEVEQYSEKDILIVLDQSGSMEGEKLEQALKATRYILSQLQNNDRFNIIRFSTGIEKYSSEMISAGEANEAIGWIDQSVAIGSTDINRALLEAASLVAPERPTYLIFITDGLPTEGVTVSEEILGNFKSTAHENIRLFSFGVGYDVDTYLLDMLAQQHHGSSTYITPGEQIDEVLTQFYARIKTPVLTDIKIDFGALSVYDVYPNPIPDLFSGSQMVIVGRYRHGGNADITLKGKVNDQTKTLVFENQVFEQESRLSSGNTQALIPRLWATRKVGILLNKIRLMGAEQELISQIVELSIRYGIVTPYTSYLVTEESALGAKEQSRIAGEQFNQMFELPQAVPYGQDAVEKSMGMGGMAEANTPPETTYSVSEIIKITGSRTYVFRNDIWVDTAYDPENMDTIPVSFLSEDYFRLIDAYPNHGGAFALGEKVIIMINGKVYEIVGQDEITPPLVLPEPVNQGSGSITNETDLPNMTSENPGNIGQPTCIGGLILLLFLLIFGVVRTSQ